MPPDRDHVNGNVKLDDAESVMREIVSPISVPARPQPGSLARPTVDPGTELNFALVPYHPAAQARGTA